MQQTMYPHILGVDERGILLSACVHPMLGFE